MDVCYSGFLLFCFRFLHLGLLTFHFTPWKNNNVSLFTLHKNSGGAAAKTGGLEPLSPIASAATDSDSCSFSGLGLDLKLVDLDLTVAGLHASLLKTTKEHDKDQEHSCQDQDLEQVVLGGLETMSVTNV